MKLSYALKDKLGNTKFLAKLEWVRKAKVIAQLKFNNSKKDELGSAGSDDKCPRSRGFLL